MFDDDLDLLGSAGACSAFMAWALPIQVPAAPGHLDAAGIASLSWGGVWSGASYSSGTDLTTFTGEFGTPTGGGALGDSVKPGMVVIPDLHKAVPLHIESVNVNLLGSDTLTVKGDATGLGGNGTRFRIHQHAPYKYDLTDEVKRNNPCDLGSRYLWSNYRRMPWTWSRAGEDPYLAWNRVYLPEIGRWTSADPLGSPWWNLNIYGNKNPLAFRDVTGLESYDFDESACTVTMEVFYQWDFYDDLKFTHNQMTNWDAESATLIKEQWSDNFVLKSSAAAGATYEETIFTGACPWPWTTITKPCPCQESGWTTKLVQTYTIYQITEDIDVRSDDFEIHVSDTFVTQEYSKTENEIRVHSSANGKMSWFAGDGTALGTQAVIAHEFGHWLGLSHPGKGDLVSTKVGAGACYKDASGKEHANPIRDEYFEPNAGMPSSDIMGIGSGLKAEYAAKWLDALNDEWEDCGPYTASLK